VCQRLLLIIRSDCSEQLQVDLTGSPIEISAAGSGASGRFHRGPTNGRYRRNCVVAVRSGRGPLTEPSTATHSSRPELLFMPHRRPQSAAISALAASWEEKQGEVTRRPAGSANGCIRLVGMRGHGFASAARLLIEVVRMSVYLARNARTLLRVLQLGGEIKYLSPGEIAARNRGYSPYSAETWHTWEYSKTDIWSG
jgi:hypothetical protein